MSPQRIIRRGAIYAGREADDKVKQPDEMQTVADTAVLPANSVMDWNSLRMREVLEI